MCEVVDHPHMVRYNTLDISGVRIFYREAGDPSAPAILLLHGFPTSSHMYRNLMPRLADRYHLIAPDLPGFGFSEVPPRDGYSYTFDNLAQTIGAFTDALRLERYAMQVFDYGAPVGFRLAMERPERTSALITQNGNAYEEGLSDGWKPLRRYWQEPTNENRNALRSLLTPESVQWQYLHGTPAGSHVAPEAYTLDAALLSRPDNSEAQLDLFLDYATNLQLYPSFHKYFRESQLPALVVWGTNDPFFLPAGAHAYKRDLPDAELHLFDTGHFALETHLEDIAGVIRTFLARAL